MLNEVFINILGFNSWLDIHYIDYIVFHELSGLTGSDGFFLGLSLFITLVS